MDAVLEDKAKSAITNAGRMKPGNAEIAIRGTARQFNLDPTELGREVAAIVARSAGIELAESCDALTTALFLLNAAHPAFQAQNVDPEQDTGSVPRA